MQKNNVKIKQNGIMETVRWRKIVEQQHEKTMEAIRWRKVIEQQHKKTMVRGNPDIMIKIRETCFPDSKYYVR